MWLFSEIGFFSVVEHTEQKDNLLIRARLEADLQNFCDLLETVAGTAREVEHTPNADYHYRIVATKEDVAKVAAFLILQIDYPNYKNHIAQITEDRQRLDAYSDVWATMRHWQEDQEEELPDSYGFDMFG